MRILAARVENFRNLSCAPAFGRGFNVFVGLNGQGKTNLLEALYFAGRGRSFRSGNISDMVAFDREFARVEVDVESAGVQVPVVATVSGRERNHAVGGRQSCSLKEVGEVLKVVFFGPEDLHLVKGGRSGRRDFLDGAIAVHHPPHEELVRRYNHLLRERNQLLREFATGRPPPQGLLESYEEQLARHGAQLLHHRLKYLREFKPVARELVSAHTAGELALSLTYETPLESVREEGDEVPETAELRRELQLGLEKDRAADGSRGATSVGPHRDDLTVHINGRPARYFASQGEQRQVAVSLRIAQLALWHDRFSIRPVLLLDDVLSELDPGRARLLLEALSQREVHTLISTTTRPDVISKGQHCVFEMTGGRIVG